ncbi:50S ribosomal protein L11 methyltransferase [Marinobacteraceae bacterium S3BR75-40.1]
MSPQRLNAHIQRTLAHGRVALSAPRGCPEIPLYLFDPAVLEGPLTHDQAQAVVAEPAYWSFCWASGQVLAAAILAHPEWVRGKRVIDFGSGSGIVAIAAALAGAREVVACDLDAQALDAVAANAAANDVTLSYCRDWFQREGAFDLVTAADVLYDPDNRPFLDEFVAAAPEVLLADSRVKNLDHPPYVAFDEVECTTWPDLNEFEEFNRVRLYRARTS